VRYDPGRVSQLALAVGFDRFACRPEKEMMADAVN
jgi:hypothetical protein